jgi:transposase
MRKIVDASKAVGAKIVLMTPPPFDPFPLKGTEKLRSLDAKQFAWFAPYEKYDSDVLAKYSEWVGQQSDVDRIIDLHQALSAYIQNRRASDASFALAKDGVHFGDAIHEFVAGEVIKGLGLPLFSKPSKRLLDICHQRQCLLRDAWLSEIGHKRPGVKAGLPVLEAEKKAEQLRFQAQELVK